MYYAYSEYFVPTTSGIPTVLLRMALNLTRCEKPIRGNNGTSAQGTSHKRHVCLCVCVCDHRTCFQENALRPQGRIKHKLNSGLHIGGSSMSMVAVPRKQNRPCTSKLGAWKRYPCVCANSNLIRSQSRRSGDRCWQDDCMRHSLPQAPDTVQCTKLLTSTSKSATRRMESISVSGG